MKMKNIEIENSGDNATEKKMPDDLRLIKEKIIAGLNQPLEECLKEEEVKW